MRLAVTMTSDFICPWCYIGEAHLRAAIVRLPPTIEVELLYRPFELNPDMPAAGVERRVYRTAKFGSWERSLAMDAQVTAAGAAAGLDIRFDRQPRTPSTMTAHRLTWAAAAHGADQPGLAHRIFAAYFNEGRDISDPAILRPLAAAAGLAAERIDAVLDGDAGRTEVAQLVHQAYASGINGVPLFQIGGYALSGAQPVELLEQALRRAAHPQAA